MRFMKGRWLGTIALTAMLGMGACSDSLFDVKNPGKILDEDLNTERGVDALVTGMSADYSSGYDNLSFLVARLSDEMVGSGSYFSTGRYRRGLFDSEDSDGYWGAVQRARWVAEAGLIRMENIEGFTFAGNAKTGRAYLFAGLANRWFGENFCEVVFNAPYETDTGEAQPRNTAFERAIPELQAAVANGSDDIPTAAHGALAQVYVGLGQWANAMSEAAQVPTSFVYEAVYSANSGRETNQIWSETWGRAEISAWGTLAGTVGAGDPRTPWTDCTVGSCNSQNGADGQTIHYRQEKYPTKGGNIPLVKGTDMRLYEAENALLGGDLATAISKINEVRTFWGIANIDMADVTGIGSITGGEKGGANPTSMSGWDILDRERHLTNWLEGRRLWDLARWDHPHLDGGGVVYEATVARRASCLPISDQECQTNPKVADKCFTL
jgi:starch-binding outer membrane protein, SusD/RagB family